LINCLHHDVDPVNRGAAATALGKIGAPGAVPALIDCLYHDGDSLNRAAAATALASIGAHEAVPALAACLSDKADEVRSSAATALGRIVTEKTVAIVADAISALAQALNLRTEAARVIGAGSFLRAAFRSGNPEVAQRFVEGFVSGIDNGEEAFLPHRIALNFLRSNRDLMILSRQPPEMREAVELLISLFDQNGKGD
jgi:HEAT repeat protein